MPIHKVKAVLVSFTSDIRGTLSVVDDATARLRLIRDFALSRVIGFFSESERNRVREVLFGDDIKIRYRLNKGDLHAIREIWFQECYRPHFGNPSGVLLDLGANIGMTSLWLAKKYPVAQVIAVEPDPHNAALARQNLELNGINAHVLEAAIGPEDGTGRFASSDHSIMGRLSDKGTPVQVMSVDSIMKKFDVTRFALVKIDIEGGEQALFEGPTDWLDWTDAILIEFHPEIVDHLRLIELVKSHGFDYIPTNLVFRYNCDCFVRQKKTDTSPKHQNQFSQG